MESSLPYDIPYLQRVYLFYYLLLHYNLVTIILISSSTSNLFRVHLLIMSNFIKNITTSCLWIKRVSWSFFGFVTSVMISISFSSWFNLFLPDELNLLSEETSVAESLGSSVYYVYFNIFTGSSVYYYYYYVLQLWHLYFLDYHLFVQRISSQLLTLFNFLFLVTSCWLFIITVSSVYYYYYCSNRIY